jgi:hypothetical protein
MTWLTVSRKAIALAMCFLIVATPLLAQKSESKVDEYMQGRIDGESSGKGSAGYLLLGLACGAIGFVAAAVSEPSPPAEIIMGKSQGYVLGFTDGYRSKAKRGNMVYAGVGWAVSAVLWTVVALAIIATSESSSSY